MANYFAFKRTQLYNEIWEISARKVAEKHGISYTRLLAKCRECNIPIPPSGYFTKRQFGKPVVPTPLPESAIQTVTIECPGTDDAPKEPAAIPVPIAGNAVAANPAVVEPPKESTTTLVPPADDASIADPAITEPPEDAVEGDSEPRVPLARYVDPNQPLREELFQKVWERPMSEVSKEYGISDVALHKRCVKLSVPVPERGYWAKVRAGKSAKRPASLPVIQNPEYKKPKLGDPRELHIKPDALSFLELDGRAEILSLAARLEVGGPSAKMLDSVEKLEEQCKEWHKKDIYGNYPARNYRYATAPFLAEAMTPKCFSRAFHIIDALVKALQPYQGRINYDNQLIVNGEPVSFTMEEGKDMIPHEITTEERLRLLKYEEERKTDRHAYKPRIPKYDHPWNQQLSISINGKYRFTDCKSYMLEDRIGEILIAFYEASYDERLKRLAREEEERKEQEEYERKQRMCEEYNFEVARTKSLENEAADYAVAWQIRAYIAQIQQMPGHPKNNPQWLEWASAKADWYDPTISREDAYFGKRNHGADAVEKELTKK